MNISDNQYPITSDANFVYFPVTEKLRRHRLNYTYKKLKRRSKKSMINGNKLKSLGSPNSFDMTGDILILKIPKGKKRDEKKIANLLLKQNKNARIIAKTDKAVHSKYRLRKLKIIGERKTRRKMGLKKLETVHTESGCKFKVDISKAYFSPRLSFERLRVSKLVKRNEIVFIVGAGVGPFAIIIAKQNPGTVVYANEFNPEAVKYLKENIKLNKLTNVTIVKGDIRQIAKRERYKQIADRVLIPAPMQAEKLLKSSLKLCKNKGIVHYYEFTESKEKTIKKIKTIQTSVRVMGSRAVKTYSPTSIEVVIDLKLT